MHALNQAWETVKTEFEAASTQAAQAAQRQVTNELNQILRRLRHYRSEAEFVSAVLDGASRFAQQVALFDVNRAVLYLRGRRKLDVPENLSFGVDCAAAFRAVIDTQDSVTALRSTGEVSDSLSSPEAGARAHLVPIMNAGRVAAILFAADHDSVDVNGLELMAGLASAVLERQSNTALHTQIAATKPREEREISAIAPPRIEGSAKPVSSNGTRRSGLPPWADLCPEHRDLHIRAQRYSRVAVAEMELSRPDACRAGREQKDLYLFLKKEIGAARETYRKQFMTIPSMVDYLHLELVRTAAEGDELKMGAEYPGQLV